MESRTLLITACFAALALVTARASANDNVADRAVETDSIVVRADAPATQVEPRASNDNLQTARRPDEFPFSEIKILPSF